MLWPVCEVRSKCEILEKITKRERERVLPNKKKMGCIEDGGHLMGLQWMRVLSIQLYTHMHIHICRERRGKACINGGDRDSCSMRESTDPLQKNAITRHPFSLWFVLNWKLNLSLSLSSLLWSLKSQYPFDCQNFRPDSHTLFFLQTWGRKKNFKS